jgi:hypothetical protein
VHRGHSATRFPEKSGLAALPPKAARPNKTFLKNGLFGFGAQGLKNHLTKNHFGIPLRIVLCTAWQFTPEVPFPCLYHCSISNRGYFASTVVEWASASGETEIPPHAQSQTGLYRSLKNRLDSETFGVGSLVLSYHQILQLWQQRLG